MAINKGRPPRSNHPVIHFAPLTGPSGYGRCPTPGTRCGDYCYRAIVITCTPCLVTCKGCLRGMAWDARAAHYREMNPGDAC